MTDFNTISPTMQIAVELAVNKGIPFSTFNDSNMRKLVTLAKKGGNDSSVKVINSENVRSAIQETAKEKRDKMAKLMKNKVISLSADLATCEARSFIGEL